MERSDGIRPETVTGVVLAGGAARRMGGSDKGLIRLAGRPMIEYVLDALRPQVGSILINANRNPDQYARYGIAVIADERTGFQGPLAGMAAAMQSARTEFIVTAPCDSPFVPADLVRRLGRSLAADRADIGVAHADGRLQPVFTLLRVSLLGSLIEYLDRGERKIDLWFSGERTATADFSDVPEAFLNINTPDDVREIEAKMREPARAAH
ncbi:MAG TPA: molybdenum cofactor guanylyltransferase MobA [Gammaproteobacteria bacterium]